MNRQQKNNIYWIVGFLILSIGLFAYQNFLMPAQQMARQAVIYVATQDLSDDTIIKAEEGGQFQALEVAEDSVIPGSVTDLKAVDGQSIEGGLLKGELLTTNRLVEDERERGNLFVKVEPDYPVDIRDGENVHVFVQGNFGTGNVEVKSLFQQKKVYSSSRVTNLLEGESSQGYYLRMSEEELKDYYLSKSRGAIILAKISPTAKDVTKSMVLTNKPLEDLVEKTVDAIEETEDAEEEIEEVDEPDMPAVRYEAQEGDTYETVAHALELSVEELKAANPAIDTLRTGDFITLPGAD